MPEDFLETFLFTFISILGFFIIFIVIFVSVLGYIIYSLLRERKLADSPEFEISSQNSTDTLNKLLSEISLQTLNLEKTNYLHQIFIHEGKKARRKYRIVTGFCNNQGEPAILACGLFFIEFYGNLFSSKKKPDNRGYITCKFDDRILRIEIQDCVFDYYLNGKQVGQFFTGNNYITLKNDFIWHDRNYYNYSRPEFMTDEQRPRTINFYSDKNFIHQISKANVSDSRYSSMGIHEIIKKTGENINPHSPRVRFNGDGNLKFTDNSLSLNSKSAILAFYITDTMFFV